jgi:predicted dehydrogenase
VSRRVDSVGIGVVGFGWMGQAHSRSYLRLPTLFADLPARPRLVACADADAERRDAATGRFGFERAAADWRAVVDDPGVDAVVVAAPNMLHLEVVEAAAAAGKAVFCEKPVGGTPAQTARAEAATRRAGVVGGVGYNYRFAPLVRYAAELVRSGRLGEITVCRARFLSMYGADPRGVLSWRFRLEEGGHGVTSDLLSHAVDLVHALVGPVARVVGATETFVRERPLPSAAGTHYSIGAAGGPTGTVTNEDYAGCLVEFASGARGSFESSRTLVGPESELAFEVYGTGGAVAWSFERLNELRVYLCDEDRAGGWRRILGGDRFEGHGAFVPGSGNAIGFEDLVALEDRAFLAAVATGEQHEPGLTEALAVVEVQDALLRSAASGRWEDVSSLRLEP